MYKSEAQNRAEAIAKALGGEYSDRHVTMPDGCRFFMSVAEWAGPDKVYVGVRFPSHKRLDNGTLVATTQRDFDRGLEFKPVKDISFSINKTTEQAANDIRRRFLKDYAPAYARAVEFCARRAASADALERNRELARGVTGRAYTRNVTDEGAVFEVAVRAEDFDRFSEFVESLAK